MTAEQLLWTDANRFVDALRLFCGEVERVRSLRAGSGSKESGLVVQLEFASGTVGVLACTTFARPEPRQELELMGDGWSLGFSDGLTTLRLAVAVRYSPSALTVFIPFNSINGVLA